jgi:hypothetical protein
MEWWCRIRKDSRYRQALRRRKKQKSKREKIEDLKAAGCSGWRLSFGVSYDCVLVAGSSDHASTLCFQKKSNCTRENHPDREAFVGRCIERATLDQRRICNSLVAELARTKSRPT